MINILKNRGIGNWISLMMMMIAIIRCQMCHICQVRFLDCCF